MSTQTYTVAGTIKWLNRKPNEWGNYTVSFYPADASVRAELRGSGIRNKMKEDDDGLYYTFKTGEGQPFEVTDQNGDTITALVGNGSKGLVRLEVETFKSAKHGDVTRSKVIGVVVTELIVYEPPQKPEASSELPA